MNIFPACSICATSQLCLEGFPIVRNRWWPLSMTTTVEEAAEKAQIAWERTDRKTERAKGETEYCEQLGCFRSAGKRNGAYPWYLPWVQECAWCLWSLQRQVDQGQLPASPSFRPLHLICASCPGACLLLFISVDLWHQLHPSLLLF